MAEGSTIKDTFRRLSWLQHRPGWGAVANGVRNIAAFALRTKRAGHLPSLVKIDISPQCSLACPHCLHANPAGRGRPLLDAQDFKSAKRMSVEEFSAIIEQLKGETLAVSLFYYGDPLAHPDLDEMIELTRKAGLAVHITTHFSYNFTEARIRRLVDSGLSHLTVAVDGASQESYGTTRVRGRLDWVLKNLTELTAYKRQRQLSHPFVEVQHLKFPHHRPDEEDIIRGWVTDMGVDKFTVLNGLRFNSDGDLYNVVDDDPEGEMGQPLAGTMLPRCHWPFSSTVIKSNGDVIPCCLWRVGRQYVPGEDGHALGNVFDTPLAQIWNGPNYQRLRHRVARPHSRNGAETSFCDGCPKLYEKA